MSPKERVTFLPISTTLAAVIEKPLNKNKMKTSTKFIVVTESEPSNLGLEKRERNLSELKI